MGRGSDGRVVFIRGGVPGDVVSVTTIEEKKDWSRSLVEEIHVPSPMRVMPPCSRRLQGCGGCDWQHVDVAHQLSEKVGIVRDALRRTAKLNEAAVYEGIAVSDRCYRTTVRVVGDTNRRASYRMERSHRTVIADGCIIAHPMLQRLLASMELTPHLEATFRVSVATGEMTAWWETDRGQVVGLPDDVAVGQWALLHEDVAGHRFRVSARSFFQSGPAAAAVLVESVKRAAPELADASTVVDAYAGVGLFALAACSPSSRVIAIESSRSSAADCVVNLRSREAKVLRTGVEHWRGEGTGIVDVVIADPSRSGLGRGGVRALTSLSAPVIVLVSCDPVALARDASLLAAEGYRHQVSQVHDLFPHTHHVECVTRFVRR